MFAVCCDESFSEICDDLGSYPNLILQKMHRVSEQCLLGRLSCFFFLASGFKDDFTLFFRVKLFWALWFILSFTIWWLSIFFLRSEINMILKLFIHLQKKKKKSYSSRKEKRIKKKEKEKLKWRSFSYIVNRLLWIVSLSPMRVTYVTWFNVSNFCVLHIVRALDWLHDLIL